MGSGLMECVQIRRARNREVVWEGCFVLDSLSSRHAAKSSLGVFPMRAIKAHSAKTKHQFPARCEQPAGNWGEHVFVHDPSIITTSCLPLMMVQAGKSAK